MTAVEIDVGKVSLDLTIEGQIEVARYPNTTTGITKVFRRLQTLKARRTVVEATGGYEEPLLEAYCDAGLWIARVNCRQACDFFRSTGELVKTDAIDVRLPGLMARLFADRLRPYLALPAWHREMRDWLRRRA